MNSQEAQIAAVYVDKVVDKVIILIRDIAVAQIEAEKTVATGTVSSEYVQLRTAQACASAQALGSLVVEARIFGLEMRRLEQEHELEMRRLEQEHELALRRLAIQEG